MLSSLDGFIGLGHNYYLYLSPTDGPVHVHAVGPRPGVRRVRHVRHAGPDRGPEPRPSAPRREQADRPAAGDARGEGGVPRPRPAPGRGRVDARRIGADLAALEALAEEPIAKEQATARARSEGLRVGLGGPMFAYLPLDEFIEKRRASIAAQQAGTHEGHVPRMVGFGGGLGAPRETDEADGR